MVLFKPPKYAVITTQPLPSLPSRHLFQNYYYYYEIWKHKNSKILDHKLRRESVNIFLKIYFEIQKALNSYLIASFQLRNRSHFTQQNIPYIIPIIIRHNQSQSYQTKLNEPPPPQPSTPQPNARQCTSNSVSTQYPSSSMHFVVVVSFLFFDCSSFSFEAFNESSSSHLMLTAVLLLLLFVVVKLEESCCKISESTSANRCSHGKR